MTVLFVTQIHLQKAYSLIFLNVVCVTVRLSVRFEQHYSLATKLSFSDLLDRVIQSQVPLGRLQQT